MVKILLDDLMTGACHAPVNSRQGEGCNVKPKVCWQTRKMTDALQVAKGALIGAPLDKNDE